jgi:hypothetical protein
MQSFCFIISFLNFATSETQRTYQCPNAWPVVITMKEEISRHLEKNIIYWHVQMNGKKFATGQILKKTGRSYEGVDFSWLSSKVSRTLQRNQ